MVNRMKLKNIFFALAIVSIAFSGLTAQEESKEKDSDADFSAQIDKFTKRKVGEQKYKLAYKFKKGDVIKWQHDHQNVVETRFGASSNKTSTRAKPDFQWTVKNVDSLGTIRFDIEMQRIKVLEQLGESDPVNYDSDKHKEVPDSCAAYKELIGRVSATYSISPNGQVVDSKSNFPSIKLGGVGDNPVVAFPDKPIATGHKWDVTNIVKAKDDNGVIQRLELRVRYVFQKVVDGKAHITFTTSALTPNLDETVRSQIVTHLTRGFIVFDIEKGVLTNRETRWDERVIGYGGSADSYMHYNAFRREVLVQDKKGTMTKPVATVPKFFAKPVPAKEPAKTHTLLQPMKK